MKAAALAIAFALGGCVVYPRPPYGPVSSPAPEYAPGPGPGPGPAAGISREQAVDIAFGIARDRGLAVDRVQHVNLDRAGRWHVDLRGNGDRARLLLDSRDGRLLKGRFKARGGGHEGGHHGGDDQGEDWED